MSNWIWHQLELGHPLEITAVVFKITVTAAAALSSATLAAGV